MFDRTKRTKIKNSNQHLNIWPIAQVVVFYCLSLGYSYLTDDDFACTFERPMCRWRWNATIEPGFKILNGPLAHRIFRETGNYVGPDTDSSNKTDGNYISVHTTRKAGEVRLWSTKLKGTLRPCHISFYLSMKNMTNASVLVVAEGEAAWVIDELPGNDHRRWRRYDVIVGRVEQEINLAIIVDFAGRYPAQAAVDNISLSNCFYRVHKPGFCSPGYFSCADTGRDYCLNKTQICDIRIDCINGIDEKQGCDAIPEVGRCNFNNGWCGWKNAPDTVLKWVRVPGAPTYNRLTGYALHPIPENETSHFLFANMSGVDISLGEMVLLDSSIINPPPRYHSRPDSPYFMSCTVRFFFRQSGQWSGSLALNLIEHRSSGDIVSMLFYSYGDKGKMWVRAVVPLPPNITTSYHLQFEARKGMRASFIGIDDVSMSPECFGLNVPEKDKEGYNYDTFKGFAKPTLPTETHSSFVNKTVYVFTTCGATGREGPTPENCTREYNNTNVDITVVEDPPIRGIQKWIVPERNFYTIIAKGAGGGTGADGWGTSKGATAVGIVELLKGQELYILVGQEGNGGCRRNFAMTQHHSCGRVIPPKPTPPGPRYSPPRWKLPNRKSDPFKELKKLVLQHSGGGGGGGTFVYTIGPGGRVPLIVGSGGGGLGGGRPGRDIMQNGKGIDPTRLGVTGSEYGNNPPGAGGGWNTTKISSREVTGGALIYGALGGQGCGTPKSYHGMGGFGGGGGGCTSGGGGGGYSGGSASEAWKHGRGGYSFLDLSMQERGVLEGHNSGPGSVIIIPAVVGCGCGFFCAALDENLERVKCICPTGWVLSENLTTCEDPNKVQVPVQVQVQMLITNEMIFAFLGGLSLMMLCIAGHIAYKSIRRAIKRRRVRRAVVEQESSTDIQLQRLHLPSQSIMTEQNPTYEVAGPASTSHERDLISIPRENLRFTGALGQGAFGEVYQGFYRERPEDPEVPVAIKTLPAFSSADAESDFYMEAQIMSKFSHPNIVGFIGVCFEKHPRFLVLELLVGGDLKNYLRENRPHIQEPNKLTMRELLKFARDVAKGCAYLEERRFIHRDIAARNCLLTSQGPDKMVKIADFGMAKDIYRSDYYRKTGRAMLPVKWMPPEAFQDGVFTTKTDIWSYGIFLWEVMSIGFMPYTGCGNRKVMQYVVRGGRLKRPRRCPIEVYAIMKLCWQRLPEDRPTFAYILERIGYCLQDPVILSTRLPLFIKCAKVKVFKKSKKTGEGEGDAPPTLPDSDDDFEEDDDYDVIVDEDDDDIAEMAAALEASLEALSDEEKEDKKEKETKAEEDEAQPGTSKGALGKSSNSDSLETVFVVPPEPSTKKDGLPGLTGWVKRGKSKSFDFGRREPVFKPVTLDPAALPQQVPVISATRGPLGPKGRLKPSEVYKYRMHIETVGKDDYDDLDSAASDEEDSTYC